MSNIQYLYSPVKDLPDDLYKLCLWHNLHGGGSMQGTLVNCRYNINYYDQFKDYYGRVIMLWDDDQFVGWALIFRNPWDSINHFYVYVLKKFRNKGYGTIIYRITRDKIRTKLIVHPWSELSDAFFDKVVNTKSRSIEHVYSKNNYT